MMFHMGDQNLLPSFQAGLRPPVRNQIYGLRGSTHKNNFVRIWSLYKMSHFMTHLLISLGGLLTQVMEPTMNIRILLAVILLQSIDDRLWFLGRGRIVQISQGLAIDLCLKNRKVCAYGVYVEWCEHKQLNYD